MAPNSDADKAALEKATRARSGYRGYQGPAETTSALRTVQTVAEYEADELADNSEDKKKLCKARKEWYSKKRRAVLENRVRQNWPIGLWTYSPNHHPQR